MKRHLEKLIRHVVKNRDEVAPNLDATEFEVNKWVLSEFVLSKLVPTVGAHPFPLDELMLLAGTVCRFKPTHIFEWGTNIGKSARVFCETSRYFKLPLEIHSIDLPDDVEHEEHPKSSRGKLVRGYSGVNLHLGDGVETSLKIYASLPAGGRPLFFVDGDHSYGSVSRELDAIFSNVKNPIVLLHDTFYQSTDAGYNVGPNQAVSEFVERSDIEGIKRIDVGLGLPGMTLLFTSEN